MVSKLYQGWVITPPNNGDSDSHYTVKFWVTKNGRSWYIPIFGVWGPENFCSVPRIGLGALRSSDPKAVRTQDTLASPIYIYRSRYRKSSLYLGPNISAQVRSVQTLRHNTSALQTVHWWPVDGWSIILGLWYTPVTLGYYCPCFTDSYIYHKITARHFGS